MNYFNLTPVLIFGFFVAIQNTLITVSTKNKERRLKAFVETEIGVVINWNVKNRKKYNLNLVL